MLRLRNSVTRTGKRWQSNKFAAYQTMIPATAEPSPSLAESTQHRIAPMVRNGSRPIENAFEFR